jgi:hypothetical protein
MNRLFNIIAWILNVPREDPKTGEVKKPDRDPPEEHEFVNTNHPHWPFDEPLDGESPTGLLG